VLGSQLEIQKLRSANPQPAFFQDPQEIRMHRKFEKPWPTLLSNQPFENAWSNQEKWLTPVINPNYLGG
jgi:hypothetical protein